MTSSMTCASIMQTMMELDIRMHDGKFPLMPDRPGVVAIDAIWQKVDGIPGLRNDAASAKRLGYAGKSIIHPNHIEPVHEIFKPSKIEIGWATKVVNALGPAMRKGQGCGVAAEIGKND